MQSIRRPLFSYYSNPLRCVTDVMVNFLLSAAPCAQILRGFINFPSPISFLVNLKYESHVLLHLTEESSSPAFPTESPLIVKSSGIFKAAR